MKNNHSRSTAQDSAGVNGNSWWMEKQQRMAQETIIWAWMESERTRSMLKGCKAHRGDAAAPWERSPAEETHRMPTKQVLCACMCSACGRWCLTCQCISLHSCKKRGKFLVCALSCCCERRTRSALWLLCGWFGEKILRQRAERNKTKLKKYNLYNGHRRVDEYARERKTHSRKVFYCSTIDENYFYYANLFDGPEKEVALNTPALPTVAKGFILYIAFSYHIFYYISFSLKKPEISTRGLFKYFRVLHVKKLAAFLIKDCKFIKPAELNCNQL